MTTPSFASFSHKLQALTLQAYWALTTTAIVMSGVVLYLMGRVVSCTCGTIKLWHGNIWSSENSQHIADWYSFSHVIHGFVFYALLAKLKPNWPMGMKMLVAVLIEVAWEVLENSSLIINRYRDTTTSLEYTGDSIVNSIADILASLIGFWMARFLPVWMIVTLIVIFELVALHLIRDNLTLNVLMLLYPVQAIKNWQMAGANL